MLHSFTKLLPKSYQRSLEQFNFVIPPFRMYILLLFIRVSFLMLMCSKNLPYRFVVLDYYFIQKSGKQVIFVFQVIGHLLLSFINVEL